MKNTKEIKFIKSKIETLVKEFKIFNYDILFNESDDFYYLEIESRDLFENTTFLDFEIEITNEFMDNFQGYYLMFIYPQSISKAEGKSINNDNKINYGINSRIDIEIFGIPIINSLLHNFRLTSDDFIKNTEVFPKINDNIPKEPISKLIPTYDYNFYETLKSYQILTLSLESQENESKIIKFTDLERDYKKSSLISKQNTQSTLNLTG